MAIFTRHIRINEECTSCPLWIERTQIVFADLPHVPASGILAIGEAPGADEDREGVGFAGRAGQTLNKLLASHGIQREDYGRANVVRCRPPGNRKPTKKEIEACIPNLHALIETEWPSIRLVLAVGGVPASLFYSAPSLSEIIKRAENVGYVSDLAWLNDYGIRVVPMPHVSPLAWNRFNPDGEKWSSVGERQVATAVGLIQGA